MHKFLLALICISGLIIFSSNILAQEVSKEDVAGEALSTASEETAMPEETGEGVITGTVSAVNKDAKTIVLKDRDGNEKNFLVIDGETILWKGVEDIALADVLVGNEAEIGYYTDDKGVLIASWVDLIIPEEVPALPAAPETKTAPTPETTEEETEESAE